MSGNFIGTDAGGTVDLGNALAGVLIEDGSDNTIGGTTAGAANVISGNGTDGVAIVGLERHTVGKQDRGQPDRYRSRPARSCWATTMTA